MDQLTIGIIGGAIGTLGAGVIAHEWRGWAPMLRSALIKVAADRLPPELRDRMREEWTSHVADMPTEGSKFVTAFGFLLASVRIEPPRIELPRIDVDVRTSKSALYLAVWLQAYFRVAYLTARTMVLILSVVPIVGLRKAIRTIRAELENDLEEREILITKAREPDSPE